MLQKNNMNKSGKFILPFPVFTATSCFPKSVSRYALYTSPDSPVETKNQRPTYCPLLLLVSEASLHNRTMRTIFLYIYTYIYIYIFHGQCHTVISNLVINFEPLLQRQRWLRYTLRIASQQCICILLVII